MLQLENVMVQEECKNITARGGGDATQTSDHGHLSRYHAPAWGLYTHTHSYTSADLHTGKYLTSHSDGFQALKGLNTIQVESKNREAAKHDLIKSSLF